jgi:Zn-dependent M32 family carboxypeptidase
MMNYAIGAILAADLRARSRELRGAPAGADYYAWLSERLLRFGLEKSSAEVLRDFLGRAPDPRALLADMRRATPAVKAVQ